MPITPYTSQEDYIESNPLTNHSFRVAPYEGDIPALAYELSISDGFDRMSGAPVLLISDAFIVRAYLVDDDDAYLVDDDNVLLEDG
jgi:hypothetical protein